MVGSTTRITLSITDGLEQLEALEVREGLELLLELFGPDLRGKKELSAIGDGVFDLGPGWFKVIVFVIVSNHLQKVRIDQRGGEVLDVDLERVFERGFPVEDCSSLSTLFQFFFDLLRAHPLSPACSVFDDLFFLTHLSIFITIFFVFFIFLSG